jgi:murein DD-endopeptidase MepM/ murein hydrolase activator NlpD
MAAIIENQHIAKRGCNNRRKSSSFRPNNKSAGFNTEFMGHFRQNPVYSNRKRIKRKNHFSLSACIGRIFTGEPERSTYGEQHKKRIKNLYRNTEANARKSERNSGFSFPVPSAATLLVTAATVLIALTALKWEDLNIQSPVRYAFAPAVNEDIENRTLLYAETGISDITAYQLPSARQTAVPEITVNITEAVPASAETSNIGNAEETPRELLVTFQWNQYRVQRGDNVTSIAKKYGVSIGAIIASNEIRNARRLQEGALLRIPNIDGIPYTVKSGDSLSRIATSFNVPLEVILDVNDIRSDNIKAGETIFIPGARMNDMDLRASLGDLFIYPVQSRFITSSYGMRKDPISGQLSFHTGIDLRGNKGAAVMAAMDGVVSAIGENWLYGKYIILSHSNGFKTLYAHLSSQSVKTGDRVSQGRKIGEVGDTGYSTGPHLHFSVYDRDGKYVNPLDLMN